MSSAWAKNERMVAALDQKEGHYEGGEKAPKKKIKRVSGSGREQTVEYSPNAVLGLDSDLFHMGGEHVTNLKEERLEDGRVLAYWQAESGGTYVTEHEQVDERTYRQTTKPRRIYGF